MRTKEKKTLFAVPEVPGKLLDTSEVNDVVSSIVSRFFFVGLESNLGRIALRSIIRWAQAPGEDMRWHDNMLYSSGQSSSACEGCDAI